MDVTAEELRYIAEGPLVDPVIQHYAVDKTAGARF